MESDPVPLFYQSGLLSIKGYEREFQIYHWGFPNKEVVPVLAIRFIKFVRL